MAAAKQEKKKTINIRWNNEDLEIDLDKQCPKDLLETAKYIKMPYMPIKLIRKIGRQLGWKTEYLKSNYKITEGGILFEFIVDVETDKGKFSGLAIDYVGGKSVSKSLDGQTARIKALAIKDALKRAYPFFDIDFDEADDAQQTVGKEPVEFKSKTETASISTEIDFIAEMGKKTSVEELKAYAKANKATIAASPKKQQIADAYVKLVEKLTK